MAQCFGFMGNHERAVAVGQRALALATASGEVGIRLTANYYLAAPYSSLGDYHRAMDCYRQSIDLPGRRASA